MKNQVSKIEVEKILNETASYFSDNIKTSDLLEWLTCIQYYIIKYRKDDVDIDSIASFLYQLSVIANDGVSAGGLLTPNLIKEHMQGLMSRASESNSAALKDILHIFSQENRKIDFGAFEIELFFKVYSPLFMFCEMKGIYEYKYDNVKE